MNKQILTTVRALIPAVLQVAWGTAPRNLSGPRVLIER